jgi:hypothetical protein
MDTPRYVLALAAAAALVAASGAAPAAQGRYGGGVDRLSGTFELDRTRSDDPQRVVTQATRSMDPGTRDRVSQNLTRRLDAPDAMAIDVQGNSVSVMSSSGPRVNFRADGRSHTETGPNGRPTTTNAQLQGSDLIVTTSGNRGSDFTVHFDPVPGGMRVTRELDSDMLQGTVSATSFYRRTADAPRWDIYRAGPPPPPPPSSYRRVPPGPIIVPEGTSITARLDRPLDSRSAREGDHFSMTVVNGGPYDGAVLDGIVIQTAGGGGRANMAFDFDSIQTRDGRTGPFEGAIDSVRTPNGETLRVNRAGEVRDTSRGADAGDTAVGAALGAIIGAIAGGGKGAAVGAIAGGAGTVIVEGRDQLDLPAGSLINLTSVRAR